MPRAPALVLALACATAPVCAEPSSGLAPPPAPKGGGWVAAGSSLLYYSQDGRVLGELGLGRWEEELGGGLVSRRQMRGGVSKGGRFAWHWEKSETLRRERADRVLSSTGTLSYYGTSGRVLWTDELADAPAGLDPLLMSRDGEACLIFDKQDSSWTAAAVTFVGNQLMEVEGFGRLEQAALTANGRYAMVLWSHYDKPLVYTFMDLDKRSHEDVPAAELPSAEARLREDGVVTVGGKTVYRFP